MGEIELKFNFATESRGALFAPRQSYTYTIFTPKPCESSARAQTGYIGDSPMLLFFAILWGVPKNCITDLPNKSKIKKRHQLQNHYYSSYADKQTADQGLRRKFFMQENESQDQRYYNAQLIDRNYL